MVDKFTNPDDLPYGPGSTDYEYDRRRQEGVDSQPQGELMTKTTEKNLILVDERARAPLPAVSSDSSSLMKIIDRAALDPNFDVDKLKSLLEVKERWDAQEAKKAFVAALSAFKANPPTLTKNKHVSFETSKGLTEYHHATLDHVSTAIGKSLAEHGFSHRWDIEQLDGGQVKVTCVLTHVLGHSERVPMISGRDESGGKNNIQALGSTVTYLQRYTLLAATGMAAKGQDNDGADNAPLGLSESALADHQAALSSAATIEELQVAYTKAVEAAKAAGDKPALRNFINEKNVRKKALEAKK